MSARAVLGLSGGVDSAVGALLLRRAGYEVLGVYLKSACARDFSSEAERAAHEARIGFRSADITEALDKFVKQPFVEAYASGRTPNPCVLCNPLVKFRVLSEIADSLGGGCIATGHYVKNPFVPEYGRKLLVGGGENDQSYMLSRLPREYVERSVFPLSGMKKSAVRALAESEGLSARNLPDSMEICFVPDGNFAALVEQAGKNLSGNFIDINGKVLGKHSGIHRLTVGQRQGLGIALGHPVTVLKIDPVTRDVTLGDEAGAVAHKISIKDCVWHMPRSEFAGRAKVRHSRAFYGCAVTPDGEGAVIEFPDGVRAPAPGQNCAVYADTSEGLAVAVAGEIE